MALDFNWFKSQSIDCIKSTSRAMRIEPSAPMATQRPAMILGKAASRLLSKVSELATNRWRSANQYVDRVVLTHVPFRLPIDIPKQLFTKVLFIFVRTLHGVA
jgi:hypothetical protein